MDGHVACMGVVRNAYKCWLKNLHLESLHMNGSIVLKYVFRV
jgi:hypothetical protein